MTSIPRDFVLIGHPGHKRVKLFQEALGRRGLPPARLMAWRDLLSRPDDLQRAVGPETLIRIESPGQDFEVEKLLIAAGAHALETEDDAATSLSADHALGLPFDRGRLRFPRQWYRGFRATLHCLAALSASSPGVRWMSHPDEIITLFDKRQCYRRFAAAGLPVPKSLGSAASFQDLLARMHAAKCRRVFVKLACGSSASGVVAFRIGGPRMQAITTVEMDQRDGHLRLYNSRRIRRYEAPADIQILIDALCREGVHVEEWIPKAGFEGDAFDLRVVVIAGEIRHIMPRLSRQPMTNLHLLNRRGDSERIRSIVPPASWEGALETCRRAARLFPRCHHVGIDLLFTPGFRGHALVEANAFGDLLPGLLWNGLDTYDAQLAALLPGEEETRQ
jgi:glutathione synthase/RimK-type ligase-like ATP-grasp enzyme